MVESNLTHSLHSTFLVKSLKYIYVLLEEKRESLGGIFKSWERDHQEVRPRWMGQHRPNCVVAD